MQKIFIKGLLFTFFLFFVFFVSVSKVNAFSCSSNGAGGGNFNIAGTWTDCNSTTPQTTDSIIVNSGDTVTLVGTTTVAGITINNGGIFAANTRTITNTDGYTNNGSHTGTTSKMTLSGPSGSIIDGTGTYSPTGIVTVSTDAKTIASGSQLSFGKITVTGVILTNNSTAGLTVVTALAGTGQLTQGASSILNIGGTSAITTLDASASPNDVHYTSTSANQTIHTGTYHNLFIDKSGRIGTLGDVITVNNNLSVTAGSLADGGFQITGNATGTFTLSASTTLTLGTTATAATATSFPTGFTSGHIALNTTSTVNYNFTPAVSGGQTISNVPTYGILKTTATAAVTKTAAGAFTVNGLFTNGTNNAFADGGFTITLKDGATMTGSHTGAGKILFTGGSSSHSVSGTYSNVELDDSNGVLLSGTTTINGTLTITSGTWDTDARTTSVVGATSVSGTLAITSTTGTKTFSDIIINNGGAMSFSAAEAMAINGDLTVNGTGVISGTSGTWTFQKVGGGTIGGTASSLSISGGATFATQYSINYPLTVNTFTVNAGIIETNTSTITVNGTLGGAGTFTQDPSAVLSARSITITTLNATAAGNIVHLIGGVGGTIKGTSYVDLDINKTTGFTATANGTVNVAGNLTVTAGTIRFAGSTFTVTGTTDIYGTLTDNSGGGGGGNNVFQGLVTIHPGAIWLGVVGEVCDFHFGAGLVMNGASFTSSTGVYYFETNSQSITGSSSFTIDNVSVTGIQLTNSSTGTLTIRTALSGTGEFKQDANAVLNITGISSITTFTASAAGNSVSYDGASAQTVHAGTYQTLNVNGNTNGSMDITADTTVNTVLNLGAVIFLTASNKMILGTSATVSRTSGYVVGTIRKLFISSTSFTYDIGDAANYTPVNLTFSGVSGSGSVDGSVASQDDSDIANSGIDSAQSVNRYWTITNNGLTFGSYDAVLNFVNGDFDSGVSISGVSVAKKNSGSWSIVSATCASVSCTLTGLTSMSEFQIGVAIPTPTSTSTSTSSTSSTSSPDSSSSGGGTATIQNAIAVPAQSPLPQAISGPPALFDILSSPLFPDTGSAITSRGVIIFAVVAFAFLAGSSIGIISLLILRRRRRSRVLPVYRIRSRRRHIV